MKICIATTAFPRWQGDFRGIFVFEAARALASRGCEVKVVAMHNPGAKTHENWDGIELRWLFSERADSNFGKEMKGRKREYKNTVIVNNL